MVVIVAVVVLIEEVKLGVRRRRMGFSGVGDEIVEGIGVDMLTCCWICYGRCFDLQCMPYLAIENCLMRTVDADLIGLLYMVGIGRNGI